MVTKIFIVMPAYNAEKTLEKVYKQIPKKNVNTILLVDDGSTDKTVVLAKKLGIETIVHGKNIGYGGNQKTCYAHALKRGATHVVMLHPDGQYDGADFPAFMHALVNKKGDLILGSRFLGKYHGTPFYKSISIRFLTFLYNAILRLHLTEVSTGYRGFTREFLEKIPFDKNGNGYIFDPQVILQAVYFGFKIAEVSVKKDYLKEASSPNFSQSVWHGIENLLLLTQYILHMTHIKQVAFLTEYPSGEFEAKKRFLT